MPPTVKTPLREKPAPPTSNLQRDECPVCNSVIPAGKISDIVYDQAGNWYCDHAGYCEHCDYTHHLLFVHDPVAQMWRPTGNRSMNFSDTRERSVRRQSTSDERHAFRS